MPVRYQRVTSTVLKAAELRHEVAIQTQTKVSDGQGGYTRTWATAETVYAKIEPVIAEEFFFAGQEKPGVSHRVVIRYTTNAIVGRRLLWGSRILRMVSVRNIEERDIVTAMLCQEEPEAD